MLKKNLQLYLERCKYLFRINLTLRLIFYYFSYELLSFFFRIHLIGIYMLLFILFIDISLTCFFFNGKSFEIFTYEYFKTILHFAVI